MNWTEEKIAEFVGLIAKGLSAGQVAKEMNISRGTVNGKAHRLGLRWSYRKLNPTNVTNRKQAKVSRIASKPLIILKEIEAPVADHIPQQLICYGDLTEYTCHWQIGDMYCGDQVESRKRYCTAHCKVMYQRK